MSVGKLIVAFSGGKDSTAMALRMSELGESAELLFTPAANEPLEVFDHVQTIAKMTGWPLVRLAGPSLMQLITRYKALPNWRQRWCTREIKILPCIAYLKANPGSTLCVGLRADEPLREGLYGDFAIYRYPLREWGWGIDRVVNYCNDRQVSVPKRTDCELCYGQRLNEWYRLWRDVPATFATGERLEGWTGFTFRSPGRDTWPAGLTQLRLRFEAGDRPRGAEDVDDDHAPCRVCRS